MFAAWTNLIQERCRSVAPRAFMLTLKESVTLSPKKENSEGIAPFVCHRRSLRLSSPTAAYPLRRIIA
jgi:hypothetical protein